MKQQPIADHPLTQAAEVVSTLSGAERVPFHLMAKPAGSRCNLDCTYCFYLEKERLYPGLESESMAPDVLEQYIAQYIASQPQQIIQFAWQGGEPTLLGIPFFERVLALQQVHAGGKQIENMLQTNGILIDAEWAAFLAANNFLVGLSIDGPRELHNHYRVDKGQQPTFDRVMRGLAHLREAGVQFNTLTVVNALNSHQPFEVYRFLKGLGGGLMQFIPVVERVAETTPADGLVLIGPASSLPARVSDWSVDPQQYGNFLCAIFDEWVRHDVGRHAVQLFEVTLESWLGMAPSLCVFAETCGSALVMEKQGDVYSCDHYVYPENRLGNIMESPLASLAVLPQQNAFGAAKRDALPRYCMECDVRFACNGECPKHRFTDTPDGEHGLNYLCKAYKQFFHHVAPYMEFMGREWNAHRPPAGVMEYALWADAQIDSSGPVAAPAP